MRLDALSRGRSRGRRVAARVAGGALCLAGLLCFEGAARAQAADFEVGPWIGWAGGAEWTKASERGLFLLNLGLDVTAATWIFGGGHGGAFEVRMGPWAAFQTPTDGQASGEGGLSLVFTKTRHASWGTFGLRTGVGHGGPGETYVTATLWGGVRYVADRDERTAAGAFSKATGIRIVMTARRIVDPVERPAVLFGVEFEPDYFLPPFRVDKWIGAH